MKSVASNTPLSATAGGIQDLKMPTDTKIVPISEPSAHCGWWMTSGHPPKRLTQMLAEKPLRRHRAMCLRISV